MRSVRAVLAILLYVFAHTTVFAQSAQTPAQAPVPRVITIMGVFQPVDGQPPRAVETVTLALYAERAGGAPLWQETQGVAVDAKGHYTVLLGATSADGIPPAILTAGARWLGTSFDRPGEVEGPRVQLTSVPYTLRSADADTLGGRPASAYVLAPTADSGDAATTSPASGSDPSARTPQVVQTGATNHLAKYVNTDDVGNSAVVESLGRVGIGTDAPLDSLHVHFTNTTGQVTGYAVQNLGNTAASYSGMLFYDQNGALGQFQGFNNVTHEYRINNIARNGANQFDGSINFMLGGASKFIVASDGSVGIGTDAPAAPLEIIDPTGRGLRVQTNGVGGSVASFGGHGDFRIDAPFIPGGRFLVTETGQVFIGGPVPGDPGFKLHVVEPLNLGLRVDTALAGGVVASFGGLGDFQIDAEGVPAGRFVVKESGSTGIGTDTPGSQLDVNGIITVRTLGAAGATTLCRNASNQISTCSSSLRYKTNVTPFHAGLTLVDRLRPIAFEWKANGEADLGLAAEDVAEVEPLLVIHNDRGEVEGVKYDRINVLLINAIKEQQAQITRQQEEIDTLKRRQDDLGALKALICADHRTAAVCTSY